MEDRSGQSAIALQCDSTKGPCVNSGTKAVGVPNFFSDTPWCIREKIR